MANAKSASASRILSTPDTQPSREEFVRQYMQELKANKPAKASITDKLVGWAEDRVVNGVKNSKRTFGRLTAAWEIADQIQDEAYAREHVLHAEQLAARLGLK